MKTTTIITDNRPIRMTDAAYKVTLEMGYADTIALVAALDAKIAEFRKLAADVTDRGGTPEVREACVNIYTNLGTIRRAFDVQTLIEGGNLTIGTHFIQS